MANIHFGGLDVDTEDIDPLVLYCPLAELEGAVVADQWILSQMQPDDPSAPYFVHRLESHKIALDIAERTFNDGVEACRKIDPPGYSISKAIKREYKKRSAKYVGIKE